MCVIYLSYKQGTDRPLFIAANRDEFYERPTQSAHFWEDAKDILGGKDLKSGGTWFAVHRDGRWAILTNYRDPQRKLSMPRSRGLLLREYLISKSSPQNFAKDLETYTRMHNYEGFSIFWGDRENLYFYSNISLEVQKLSSGLYGLSNHLLDSPWPKIVDGKKAFAKLMQEPDPPSDELLFSFLQDRSLTEDQRLPDTGVGREWERILSARFIVSPSYGTRASTLFYLSAARRQAYFTEQSYAPPSASVPDGGKVEDRREFSFSYS